MYTIGSIADIISGKKSPNKTAVQVKEIKYEKPVVKTTAKVNANKKKLNFEKHVQKKNGKFNVRKSQQKHRSTMNEGKIKTPQPIHKPTVNEILNNKKIHNANKRVSLKRKNSDTPHIIKRKKPKLVNDDSKDRKDRTVFVGNVPLDTKQNEIKQFLSSYGPIEAIRFRSTPTSDLKIPKKVAFQQGKFHPKRKSMNAYVVFKSSEDAIKAKNANGTEFKNFHLRVDSLKIPQTNNNKAAIFIGNLPLDAEEEDVRKVFQDCGAIESVRLIRDRKTNIGKGFGFVNFQSTDAVYLALQLQDVKIGKRIIRVSESYNKSLDDTNKKKTAEGKKIRERFAIHINNLPEETTETNLRNLFKPCGDILSVRLSKGKESRFCYVNFKEAIGVQNALKLSAPVTQFKINECKPKTDKDTNTDTDSKKRYPAIYIRNIPLMTKEDQLSQLFKDCGKIMSVKLFNKITRETAVGFVNFETDKSVDLALTKTIEIGNNQLEISRKVDKSEKREGPKIAKQEVIESDSDSDEDFNDDETIRNVSLADSDEPSEEEDNAEELDDEDDEDEDDEDYEDAEETEELDEEEEDSNDEVDNESDDE